jgi:hypothetical protein
MHRRVYNAVISIELVGGFQYPVSHKTTVVPSIDDGCSYALQDRVAGGG